MSITISPGIVSESTISESITVFRLICQRCGYRWLPRVPEPKRCARCRNPRWGTARTLPQLRTLIDRRLKLQR